MRSRGPPRGTLARVLYLRLLFFVFIIAGHVLVAGLSAAVVRSVLIVATLAAGAAVLAALLAELPDRDQADDGDGLP